MMGASTHFALYYLTIPFPLHRTHSAFNSLDNLKCFPRLLGDIICCCDGEADSAVAHLQQ